MNNIYDKTKDDPQPAAPDRHSSLSGSVSKHFRIGKSLGCGFYGEILSVWDKTTGSRACVRVIKSEWNHQIDNIDEISKCMNLRHENLVRYKSLILTGSPDIKALGLVMSLCLAPIRSLLPLSISECCFVIRGVVSGLAFLHTRGIVHAHVRPGSVFLHDSGAVRLGDYGLYLLAPKRRDPWESPELRSTIKIAPTTSCDIWSLGITICHCLLGSLPYKHFKLSSPAEKLPAEVKMSSLGKFIDKCLNPDPDQRPTASFLLTSEVMMDEFLAGAEMGLDMVRWLQIRPELRDRDMGEVKDRLDCDNCGKDTGYSPAFRLEHGPEFLCDDCLEKRSGHRDCQKQTEDCVECSELGKTLHQRWRRHEYLETAQSSHRNEQNNSPSADTDQNMDLDRLDVDPVPKKCAEDNNLELVLAQSSASLAGLSAETVLEYHVNSLEVSSGIQGLHVMVCGFCHSAFHFIDQFISHTHFCTSETNILTDPVTGDMQRTSEALAFILWSNTMLKYIRDQVKVSESESDFDEISIRRSIKTKWFGLSGQLKTTWVRAAEVLNHMSSVSLGISSVKKSRQESKSPINAPDKKITEDKSAAYHDHRDDRGRFASKVEPENVQKFRCEPCNFVAPTEWKLNRHKRTQKHEELSRNIDDSVEDSDQLMNVIEEPEDLQMGIRDDEIENFNILEYVLKENNSKSI